MNPFAGSDEAAMSYPVGYANFTKLNASAFALGDSKIFRLNKKVLKLKC